MTTHRHIHEGEAALQAEAGVDTARFDEMMDEAFQPRLSAGEVRFVEGRTFSVAATVDGDGRPWATTLFGRAGEMFEVLAADTVRLAADAVATTSVPDHVRSNGELGMLWFDPSLRRRAKSQGSALVEDDGSITYRMRRNFGLCNKYIHKRRHDTTGVPIGPGTLDETSAGTTLDAAAIDLLTTTDTVFLASYHDGHGADPTHRGGPAGFVTVRDPSTISIPDYTGNGMFQTLGNLLLDDHIGLTAVDFRDGRMIRLTGRGSIEESPADDVHSDRTLVISVDEVVAGTADVGTWTDVEEFELRPGLVNPATPYL